MNALRPTISRSVAQASRSQMRTKASAAFPPRKGYDFKKEWLSDPSTYPIIAIMSGGMLFMTGMTINALTYKGVYVNPNKRGAVLTTWGEEHKTGVMEKFVELRGGVRTEGLGIDHEKWAQEKEAYMKK
ncbi:unnamed protein product [Cylindrotheca closterium]|uniref:Uncharacterized protein n=1 Tax=Cylindrotheca closterium TaxID=2856 RepID=A0AAD2CP06_9STRA|nr:unnamed protein product [Cylindrotheca closterium]